jgi:hypothetical protein
MYLFLGENDLNLSSTCLILLHSIHRLQTSQVHLGRCRLTD